MRLFVGFDLPAKTRQELEDRLEGLRGALPPARWVPPANLHLTLVFLGQVAEERIPAIDRSLRLAFSGSRPIEATVRDGGTFPLGRPARVAWVGIEMRPEPSALQAELSRTMAELLERPEDGRPFSPHLTLARCRRPWRREICDLWQRRLRGRLATGFRVDRGTLFESRLGRGGAVYRRLADYPMVNGSGSGAAGGER